MERVYKVTVFCILVILVSAIANASITERVSVSSDGMQGNINSGAPSLSIDGRFVTFASYADNLISSDTNGKEDVFIKDRQTHITQRVSISSGGVQSNNDSYRSSVCADGRFVAFDSLASNLVSGDTNGKWDVFVHDMQTGTTQRISVSSSGVQGNNDSNFPSISADGRFVAFFSHASNLVSGDTNGKWDVFVHDMQTGITQRVSISSAGVQGNGDSGTNVFFKTPPSISADGRFIVFESDASNLVSGDTNGCKDAFVHDRQTDITQRISLSSTGIQTNQSSDIPSISADGRVVAFRSSADNLVSGDTNGSTDIFVHDMQTSNTERVSISTDGAQGNGESYSGISLSADGRFVAFDSYATNLISDDTNGTVDIFVHDRLTYKTQLVSISSEGAQGNSATDMPFISADGKFVAFQSVANNLVSDDTNALTDVFVHQMDFQEIQGTIKLKDFYASKLGITGTVTITDGTFTEINEIVLNGRGEYSFASTLSGNCTVVVKCSHWLGKVIPDVDITYNTTISEIALTNGDVVGNNEIDFDDINAVRAAYGSIEGEPGWNPLADVNGSGEVDFTDINIVRGNYGEIGE